MQNIDIISLAKKIGIHYSVSEIEHLCFELGIEFDEFGVNGAIANARELVKKMNRLRRIPELVKKVKIDRPNVHFDEELTIFNAVKALPEEQKKELTFLFDEWTATNQELLYWKMLHNHLDVLLNNVFDLFSTKVDEFSRKNLRLKQNHLRDLKESWVKVEIRLELLLRETNSIDAENQPHKELINRVSPNLFRKLDSEYKAICLRLEQLKPASVSRLWSLWDIPVIHPSEFRDWVEWWDKFGESNRKLKKEIQTNMSLVDDNLRKTVERLSKQTERIRGKQL